MAYDPYREQRDRRPSQTAAIVAPADDSGAQAMARGIGALGKGVGEVANAIAVRDELLADADARRALHARTIARNEYFHTPVTGLLNQKGGNGVNIRESARAELAKLDEQYVKGLSPQAAKHYWQQVEADRVEEYSVVDRHSAVQTENYIIEGRTATVNTEIENAVLNFRDPELFERHLERARIEQRDIATLQGTAPEEVARAEAELTSNAVRARVLRTAVDDPMAAHRMLTAERGRLSPEAQQALDVALKGPVTEAQANAFVSQFIGTPDRVRPNASARVLPRLRYTPSSDLAAMFVETAHSLGMDPLDFTTAISFETAGTFDPTKAGPTTKWGQHRGFIQWGEPQAEQYGVDWNDPVNSQLGANGAIARYFRDRGWRAGMSGLDLYSIINAGSPGRYDASDTAAGGTPGSVRDKWENQMGDHRAKAAALLGLEGPHEAAERRAPGIATLQAAGISPTPLGEYIVNHNGPDLGVAILQAPPGTLMSKVDPDWSGDPLATVGTYMDHATREIGADQGSQAGQYIDVTAALGAAMGIEDPAVRAAAIEKIKQFDTLNTLAKEREGQAAFDQAWTDYTVSGNTQVPLDLQLKMGQGRHATLQAAIKSGSARLTDMDTYEALIKATSDARTFAGLDLRPHMANLSDEDYRFFLGQQVAAQGAVQKDFAAAVEKDEKARYIDHNAAYANVDDIFTAYGLVAPSASQTGERADTARQNRVKAQARFSTRLMDETARTGEAPGVVRQREIAMEMMTAGSLGSAPGFWQRGTAGLFGGGAAARMWEMDYAEPGSTFVPEVKITDIDVGTREVLAAEIADLGGEPTSEEVAAEYGRRKMAEAGMAPAATLDDVPPYAQETLRKAGVAEAEIIDYYNGFMLKTYGR